jgi:hypothetical protein
VSDHRILHFLPLSSLAEEAELDEMEHINHLITLLKAEARRILAAQGKS